MAGITHKAGAPRKPRKLRVQTPSEDGGVDIRTMSEDEPSEREKPPNAERDDFLEDAKRGWQTIANDESDLRLNVVSDQEFRSGKQWDDATMGERETDGRPCLVNNRLPSFIRQITSEQIQQRPGIQVDPHDGKADQDIAEIYQGIIRRIEDQSDAEAVYEIVGDHQVTSGRGYIHVFTKYTDATGFEQEIFIEAINNPLAVYLDVSAQKPDKSDARRGYIIEHRNKADFEAEYGEVTYSGLQQWAQLNDKKGHWLPDGRVTVMHYYYVEVTTAQLALLEFPKPDDKGNRKITALVDSDAYKHAIKKGAVETNTRLVESRAAYYALITGNEILDGNKERTKGRRIPGNRVPIIPVIGEEINVAGKVDYRGVVRDAKDPQRFDNYWASSIAQALTTSSLAPWLMAEGQDEDYEDMWENANRRAYSSLKYKPRVLEGNQMVPPPQRNTTEPPIQALSQGRKQAQDDMMGVIGLHQPSLGQQGPEQSGRAIRLRQLKGEQGTAQYATHLGRAIRSVGRLLGDWIPEVYDTPRVLTIMGVNGKRNTVGVYGGAPMMQTPPGQDEPTPMSPEDMAIVLNVPKIFNLGKGQYSFSISVGPRDATRRQEDAAALTELVQAYPNAFPIIGDLVVESLDFPKAREAAGRLKALVPPQALSAGGGPSPGDVAQLQKQNQELQAELQKLQQIISTKKLELASKDYATNVNADAMIVAAALKAKTDSASQLAQMAADRENKVIDANSQRISDELGLRSDALQAHADVTSQAIQSQGDVASAQASAQAPPDQGPPSTS